MTEAEELLETEEFFQKLVDDGFAEISKDGLSIRIVSQPILFVHISSNYYSFHTYKKGGGKIPIERFLTLLKDPILKKHFLFNLDLFI